MGTGALGSLNKAPLRKRQASLAKQQQSLSKTVAALDAKIKKRKAGKVEFDSDAEPTNKAQKKTAGSAAVRAATDEEKLDKAALYKKLGYKGGSKLLTRTVKKL